MSNGYCNYAGGTISNFNSTNASVTNLTAGATGTSYTLPTTRGVATQQLTTNGDGITQWSTAFSVLDPQTKTRISNLENEIKFLKEKLDLLEKNYSGLIKN